MKTMSFKKFFETLADWLFLKWLHSLQYMGQESGGPGNQKEISVSE